jgi:hypothetical protein
MQMVGDFAKSSRDALQLLADFGAASIPGMLAQTGEKFINTRILRAEIADRGSVWIAALSSC